MYKKVRNPKEWTQEQVNFALENHTKLSNSQIGEKIDKTGYAVEQKLRRLGINRSKVINIKPGDKFNKLTAIEFSHKHSTYTYWRFKCDCGKETTVRHAQVVRGDTVSCGCFAREQFDKIHGIPENESAKRDLFYSYKTQAEKRNYSFELTREDFDRITQENCFYCGVAPYRKYRQKRNHRSKNFVYNGIDRFDNSNGYSIENCRPCCADCNRAKWSMSVDKFIEWLERLTRFQSEKSN